MAIKGWWAVKTAGKNLWQQKWYVVIVLALVFAGAAYYLINNQTDPQINTQLTEADKQEKRLAEQKKEETAKRVEDTPAETKDIAVTINRVNQIEGKLSIRATITGTTSGTCLITATNNSYTIQKSFTIKFSATSATCGEADIPISEFPTAGDRQVTVVAKNGSVQSSPATEMVNIVK